MRGIPFSTWGPYLFIYRTESYLRLYARNFNPSIVPTAIRAVSVRVRICTLHDRIKNGGFPLSVLLPKRLHIPPPDIFDLRGMTGLAPAMLPVDFRVISSATLFCEYIKSSVLFFYQYSRKPSRLWRIVHALHVRVRICTSHIRQLYNELVSYTPIYDSNLVVGLCQPALCVYIFRHRTYIISFVYLFLIFLLYS